MVAAAAMLAAAGCGKAVVDCEIVVSPLTQNVQNGPLHEAYMVTVYAWYLSSDEWHVTSYGNAEAGIIEHKVTGELRGHDFAQGQDETDAKVRFRFTRPTVLMVAVDPINKLYAWRQFNIPENFPLLYADVRFIIWRSLTTFEYKEQGWTVVNEALRNAEEEEEI